MFILHLISSKYVLLRRHAFAYQANTKRRAISVVRYDWRVGEIACVFANRIVIIFIKKQFPFHKATAFLRFTNQ